MCSLAALVGIKCTGVDHVTISPPNGYQPAGTLDPEIKHAFAVLSDPKATVDERVAAIANGESLRSTIAAGLNQDAAITKSELSIAGWKSEDSTHVEVLVHPGQIRAVPGDGLRGPVDPEENGLAGQGCYDSRGTPVS